MAHRGLFEHARRCTRVNELTRDLRMCVWRTHRQFFFSFVLRRGAGILKAEGVTPLPLFPLSETPCKNNQKPVKTNASGSSFDNTYPRVETKNRTLSFLNLRRMIYRTLGSTGEKVSAIGIGGWHLGLERLDECLSVRIVRTALDGG